MAVRFRGLKPTATINPSLRDEARHAARGMKHAEPEFAAPGGAIWSAPAERSDDGALASGGAVMVALPRRSAGSPSGVALRLPPPSKSIPPPPTRPSGRKKIAQRFNAGRADANGTNPVRDGRRPGRMVGLLPSLPGLAGLEPPHPPMNRRAILFRPAGLGSVGHPFAEPRQHVMTALNSKD